jgi:signal transduction histidine kinase
MMAGERVVALLEIHADAPNSFTEEHKSAISMAANIAAHSIDSLRLLARDRERENQLKQAQKMEALGRLAGGVAHDFNNITTGVLGYCDLAKLALAETNPPVVALIDSAKEVAGRATLFTNQLLGFSRGQVLAPRSLDLNKAIKDFTGLTIARLIGEHIEISYNLSDDIPAVYLDPVQVQQIILNLAINSRDAMSNGGQILIETRVVQPKETGHKPAATKNPDRAQVIMTFSDTGCGMDSETQKLIFEPFFTTKPTGVGTGLGLPVSKQIMDLHGGAIDIRPAPDGGVRVTLMLKAEDGG